MLWIEDQYDLDLVDTLCRELSITTTLSKFLISTGIEDSDKAENFLNPKLAHFADPFDIPGMIEAVNRICQALQKKEKILIIGDYDVDGITSTVIIKKNLTNFELVRLFYCKKQQKV